ncbi:MAG: hypothetical protein KDD99_28100, partial [Bacteroidetes bacterium]|nr:hypothetical protein [Bacteroidota bacterium]
MPEAQTILPDNSHLPEYLDFDKLRILGRNRIAQLSGKIWTDHNIHDPGITILEVLSYAIMDIGYRNQLPDKELFARNLADGQQEDNFFTPAQILSANPLTILDFRKLILDIDGVRNVWLEIADKSEVDVEIDCQRSRLSYVNPQKENGFIPLHINGLYKVLLDLDPLNPVELTEENVVRAVRDLLHQHRNLCEDFVEIKVLKDTEIAICSELELASNADPDATMVKVLEVIN